MLILNPTATHRATNALRAAVVYLQQTPMSEQKEKELLTTNRKALTINLDEPIYGTFAEIGAGQEVARMFFQVVGASGTIAKSISAYDMSFSDAIYGKPPTTFPKSVSRSCWTTNTIC